MKKNSQKELSLEGRDERIERRTLVRSQSGRYFVVSTISSFPDNELFLLTDTLLDILGDQKADDEGETLAFPADKEGNILSWTQEVGTRRVKNHEGVITQVMRL